ncbi:MAG: reverse transcriptase [Clostridia bacterium]|nr:reverse transcriptase [Clostridia bacterium]
MVFTYAMLYQAWRDTVAVNSTEPNRARYKYYLEENLYSLAERLENGTFEPSPMRLKTIYYPKLRTAQVPSLEDKIVQHAICDNCFYDAATKPLIKETSACVRGRGNLYASWILKEQMHRYYRKHGKMPYFLKCDIHHYFASIPHDRVYMLLDRYVEDEEVKNIMRKFIGMTDIGLPLGLQQSQLLANLYLSEMDHRIKEVLRAEFYGRYMDDFYIMHHDPDYLRSCLAYIDGYVQSIGLTLNPKTEIHRGNMDYLGFNYHLTDTGKVIQRLVKSKRNTKRRQLKKMLRDLAENKITAEEFAASYLGWRAHALQGDCYALVAAWDDWLRGELKKIGYHMIATKGRIWIHATGNHNAGCRDERMGG